VSGSPAYDGKKWRRAAVAVQELPEVLKELRALRRRIEALEKGTKS
jgi:UDP-3-O-[3-hydroxymyristoyl] glucosamine N-acyltransferase